MEKVSRSTMAWRMAAITIVVALAIIGILSEPTGMVNARWWMVLAISKIVGAAFATLVIYLYKKWEINNIFDCHAKMSKEGNWFNRITAWKAVAL